MPRFGLLHINPYDGHAACRRAGKYLVCQRFYDDVCVASFSKAELEDRAVWDGYFDAPIEAEPGHRRVQEEPAVPRSDADNFLLRMAGIARPSVSAPKDHVGQPNQGASHMDATGLGPSFRCHSGVRCYSDFVLAIQIFSADAVSNCDQPLRIVTTHSDVDGRIGRIYLSEAAEAEARDDAACGLSGPSTPPQVDLLCLTEGCVESHEVAGDRRRGAVFRVVGGAVTEYYPEGGQSAVLAYLALRPECRGTGLARRLVDAAEVVATCRCEDVHRRADQSSTDAITSSPSSKLSAFFVEVLQARDAEEAAAAHELVTVPMSATQRIAIWARLGFLPIDLDFRHPGSLRGARYHLCVRCPSPACCQRNKADAAGSQSIASTASFAISAGIVAAFLRTFFRAIVEDDGVPTEGLDVDRDIDGVGDVIEHVRHRSIDGGKWICVGSNFWK